MIAFLATRFLALPPWAIKAIELLVLLAALAGALAWAHHHVYMEGRNDEKAERKAEDDAALAAATAKAAADQRDLSNKFLLAQRDRFKENQDAQATIDSLRARVQSGAVVLHLRPGSALCSIAAPTGTAAGPGLIGEAGPSSLVPSAADAIVSIAAGIKSGVRRENSLIEAYNTARESCNKP